MTNEIKKTYEELKELDKVVYDRFGAPSRVDKMRHTKKTLKLKKLIEAEGMDFAKTLWTLSNK